MAKKRKEKKARVELSPRAPESPYVRLNGFGRFQPERLLLQLALEPHVKNV
jgi:hypothetical protein